MPVYGKVIVIRRNGSDGSQFPITSDTCMFGRSQECDIRVQLPYVSNEHCKISMNKKGEFVLQNISESNKTIVNSNNVSDKIKLANDDVITVVDRSFRFEYPENSPFFKSKRQSLSGSSKKTPLSEQQRLKVSPKIDSPFGKLVKDMKSMISSGTPLKQRNMSKEEDSNSRKNSPSKKTTPKPKRKSSLLPKAQDKGSPVPADGTVNKKSNDNHDSTKSTSNSLSIDMLNIAMIDKYSATDSGNLQLSEKENISEERKSKRLSGRRSSLSAQRKDGDKVKPVSPTDSVKKEATPNGKVDAVTAVDAAKLSKSTGSTRNAKKRRMSEPVKNEAQQKQPDSGKKKRQSRKRSSLPATTTKLNISGKLALPQKNLKDTTADMDESKDVNHGAISSHESSASVGNSLNSSDSSDVLNKGMITDSLNSGDSTHLDTSGFEKNHSSTRSSLESSKSTNLSAEKQDVSQTDDSEIVPKISLTPTNTPSDMSKDPYSFPDERSSEKAKKYRRRSSGSSGLSRKQTLLLFGSPRTKEVTPLRRSIGRLRKNSEPLVEDTEESASPSPSVKGKKIYEPLPYVEEVENSSSPIKKYSRALRTSVSERATAASKMLHRVSFGPNLSPEQFLKSLPPNTPVKKGATPKISRRKSLAASGTAPLSSVVESQEKTFKTPPFRGSPQLAKKVVRTPTPFKPDPKKLKGKPLLQQVLHASLPADKSLVQSSSSPTLTRKRKSAEIEKNEAEKTASVEKPQEKSKGSIKKVKPKRKSTDNIPIVSVHRTARNLQRRSLGSGKKPLWSEIVKRPAKIQAAKKVGNKTTAKKVTKSKKVVKKTVFQATRKGHHVDSPATIYIGRTRSRIQETKTPRPSKTAAPAKLDLPSNEDYTGLSDLFATPTASKSDFDEDLELVTPKSIGEMLVSPLSSKSMAENDTAMSPDVLGIGASPEFKKLSFGDNDLSCEGSAEKAVSKRRQSKSPKNEPIETNFGTKKLFKTPRGGKVQPVEQNLGTKRLLKTPKGKKGVAIEKNFGTKRLLKTPREDKSEPVAEHFGMKRIMKTPREKKSEPVAEHFGTKRLLKSPRGKKSEAVEEHMGTKRMFKTPKGTKNQPVSSHFGTKRMFKSPREEKQNAVDEHFGTKRLLKSPRGKKSAPVENKFGMGQLFHIIPTQKKSVSEIPDGEDLHLNLLFPSPDHTDDSTEDEVTAAPVTPSRATRSRGKSTPTATKTILVKADLKSSKVTTPQRGGRSKKADINVKDAELQEKCEIIDAPADKKKRAVKSPKTKARQNRRAAKATVIDEPELEIQATSSEKDECEVVKARGKKQVTFHNSVKSSHVETELVEKAPAKTRGRTSKTAVAEPVTSVESKQKPTRKRAAASKSQEVTATVTRRGRSKATGVEADISSDLRKDEIISTKRRKLSKEGKDATEQLQAAETKSSARNSRISTKKDLPKVETKPARPVGGRNSSRKVSEEKDNTGDEQPAATDSVTDSNMPKRATRGRGKTKASEDAIAVSKKPTAKTTRNTRGKTKDNVEEAPSSSQSSDDMKTTRRGTRSKITCMIQEETQTTAPSDPVIVAKPVKTTGKRGNAQKDSAEKVDAEQSGNSQSSDTDAVVKTSRKSTRPKKAEETQRIDNREVETRPVKNVGRRGRAPKVAEGKVNTDQDICAAKPLTTEIKPTTRGKRGRKNEEVSSSQSSEDQAPEAKATRASGRSKTVQIEVTSSQSSEGQASEAKATRASGRSKTKKIVEDEAEVKSVRKTTSRNVTKLQDQKTDSQSVSQGEQSKDRVPVRATRKRKTAEKKEASAEVVAAPKIAKKDGEVKVREENVAAPPRRARGKTVKEVATEETSSAPVRRSSRRK